MSKKVKLNEALTEIMTALTNNYSIEVKIKTSKSIPISSSFEFGLKNADDMQTIIEILKVLNPDEKKNLFKNANFNIANVGKLKADKVNTRICDDDIEKIVDQVTDRLLVGFDFIFNGPASTHEDSLDDKGECNCNCKTCACDEEDEELETNDVIILDPSQLMDTLANNESLDCVQHTPRKSNSMFNVGITDVILKTWDNVQYQCLTKDAFDRVFKEYLDNGFTRTDILKSLDSKGLLHHAKNKYSVQIYGMTMYAIKDI